VIGVLQMIGDQDCLPSFAFDQRLDRVRIVLLGQIRNQDVRALAGVGIGAARPMPLSPPVMTAFMPCSLPEPSVGGFG
jgi:hypothetical protein